ncbi:hypothetical protein RHSIM_Rhsim03G0199500 [Rhododendron simsii]|uniref:Pentatricopeptide repeat-containing protein n=1 Tax=Rhododendron simsii TaxID=118357 RepID=A0A834LRP7_RHOSS|nr:hypothetical protein RHSIM_Rhsim03G0199500 [Rhododendron simsii]
MLIEGLFVMGEVNEAEMIFNGLVERNPVTENVMIKGYAGSGRADDSERVFLQKTQRTIGSSNAMISVYSRNGEIGKALELFEQTKGERNPVTWNSIISGHIQSAQREEALKLYMSMRRLSVGQTRSTFSALFHACSCLGSLQQGQLLHAHVAKMTFVSNAFVGTALLDMYCKCGSITDAQKSFMEIYSPNVAGWTALILGYAHYGLCSEALLLFEHMLDQRVDPNAATFVGVLSAYLLGQSGHLQEAEDLVKEMPIEADKVVLGALLNAGWFWMEMEMGERVARKILNLDPKNISAYVIMSNIYAGLGRWLEKMTMRKILRGSEVKKDPGCSWIELNNRVHVFSVEDRTHPCCDLIYSTLEHLTANVNLQNSICLKYFGVNIVGSVIGILIPVS